MAFDVKEKTFFYHRRFKRRSKFVNGDEATLFKNESVARDKLNESQNKKHMYANSDQNGYNENVKRS